MPMYSQYCVSAVTQYWLYNKCQCVTNIACQSLSNIGSTLGIHWPIFPNVMPIYWLYIDYIINANV